MSKTYTELDVIRTSLDKRNSLYYWFPKIQSLPINLPETIIIPIDSQRYYRIMLDENRMPESDIEKFYKAADTLGYPVFMRTSQSSNKHGWKNTCFVESSEHLTNNLSNLLEHDFLSDLVPNAIVFRKYIPMESYFTAWYGDFPVNKEIRCFINEGKVACIHSYWFEDAVKQGEKFASDKNWRKKMNLITSISDEDLTSITNQLEQVIPIFGNGWWSVDFSKSVTGTWYLIDMALGLCSYHFKGCPNEPIIQKHPKPKIAKIKID